MIQTINDYSFELSVLMNRNFRVKVGRTLVGYTGLCLSIGFLRANHLIQKCLTRSLPKKGSLSSRICSSGKVSVYIK